MSSAEKARRTALRYAAGTRQPRAAKPTTSGAAYRLAHACFGCRRSLKIAPREQAAPCPGCGKALCVMGRSFKAPPARNHAQWLKLERLYRAGFRFFSYRSHQCASLPAKLSEVDRFIREHSGHPLRLGSN
ncbi:hypothetical protein [Xanthomonas cannabis]|uniref:hypothetical protein n=1 Tax=Xanthomonas cannabis TaxID=1885674 RepID=UPI00141B7B43|nr:hypothetical protein [Xanthomonas cannabis]NIK02248.1 putative RNA-binding Zn-ribbon protein involved in translation (DUF1610 family) [Xanthomonas cannabis]NIK65293.1 putative RNA-binding Zn-ribbon protein involved in translation (DUF1610 family) [Xanthomonas cannabis]